MANILEDQQEPVTTSIEDKDFPRTIPECRPSFNFSTTALSFFTEVPYRLSYLGERRCRPLRR